MTPEQVTADPVRLRYTLVPEDLFDGVAAQLAGVRRRGLVVVLTVVPLVGLAVGLVRSRAWELSADGLAFLAVASLVVLLVVVGVSLLLYRLLLRWILRWQAGLIMRGNPWLSQPIGATVTATGVRVGNAAGESRSSWSHYPLYVETDRSFVLLASKGLGAMTLVLPKRGLADDDAARLRAMLDTHCRRRT